MTTTTPTGWRETRDGATYVAYTRTFRAPIEDVWKAVTEPERLERWIGTWTGDPADGEVEFRMTAEGEDVPAETHQIEVCEPPRRLVTSSRTRADDTAHADVVWHLEIDLTEDSGVTTLTFAQAMSDPDVAENVGPGWHYYLDRLVAAETGEDVGALDFDDYYPALAEHYRSAFS